MIPSAARAGSTTRAIEDEARLLADLLRLSRHTVLLGEAGAGKTTLLRSGVLPLLSRRNGDRYVARSFDRVVIPFPDRREAVRRTAEISIYFDNWSDAPLVALQTRIAGALIVRRMQVSPPLPPLAECLATWSEQLRVRFLFIFDRFEQYLATPLDRPGVREFADAFVDMVNAPSLPVNFLVAVRDEAEPLLKRFADRIPGFGDASVRLPPLQRATWKRTAVAHDATPAAVTADVLPLSEARNSPTPAPGVALEARDEANVLSAWEASAAQPSCTSASAPNLLREWDAAMPHIEEGCDQAAPVLPEREGCTAEAPSAAEGVAASDDEAVFAGTARPRRRGIWWAVGIAGVAAAFATTRLFEPTNDFTVDVPAPSSTSSAATDPRTAAPTPPAVAPAATSAPMAAVAPLAAASATPLPRVALRVDPGNATDAEIAGDLSKIVAADAGVELTPITAAPGDGDPSLSIVTYDAIRPPTGRSAGGVGKAFAIVTPLYTEEIHVLVRRDSPLRYVHEVRDARLNLGLPGTGNHLTAARLYERLFGAPLAAANAMHLADAQALQALLDERTIDAMVVVQAQPVRWLAELAPETAQALKLLPFDANHASTRRAIEDYLPARIRAKSYARWLSGDVSTLATMAFMVAPAATADGARNRLASVAGSLCRGLPALRRVGHDKWREVQPGLRIDGGWEYWAPAAAAIEACLANAGAGVAVASPHPPSRGEKR